MSSMVLIRRPRLLASFPPRFATRLASSATTPPPLLPALLGAASELPIPPTFDPRKEQTPPEGAPKPKTQKLGFGGSSGQVTPSWLKLGKSGKK